MSEKPIPASAAERMRKMRARQRDFAVRGVAFEVPIAVTFDDLRALHKRGLLPFEHKENPQWVAKAIYEAVRTP